MTTMAKSAPSWHREVLALRALGVGAHAIARHLGRPSATIRWVLDEHGERESNRQRRRKSRSERGVPERRASIRPEHREPRTVRRLIIEEAIGPAAREFSAHRIGVEELMARITVRPPHEQDPSKYPRRRLASFSISA